MATLLIICIYIAFIGLGIPDSLFGPAWPAMHLDLGVPISIGSILTTFITFGTMLSSYFSTRVINKFGTRNVIVVSTILTVVGLLGYSLSGNIVLIFISSIPLGLGAGAIDSGLNNYVAIHYKTMHMNFLHCFYGIGVSLSPYVMAFALADNENWRKGYFIAFIVQLAIAIVMLLSIPLWNKNKKINEVEEEKPVTLGFMQMVKTPYILVVSLVFLFYCVVEVGFGQWSASFMVGSRGFSTETAAKLAGLFYVGLAVGRFVAGLISNFVSKTKMIFFGEILTIVALLVVIFPISNLVIFGIASFLIGFGCGPIYPNLTAMTPEHYGKEYSQSIMGIEITFSYIGLFTLTPLIGVIGDFFGFEFFPYYLLIMAIITILLTLYIYFKRNSKKPIFNTSEKEKNV